MPRQTLSHCVTPPSPQPYSYTFGKPAISQRRMFSVEAGGPLNVVRHFYRYQVIAAPPASPAACTNGHSPCL